MKVCTFASASSGNCTLVSNGKTHILIDAGISMKRIKASLACVGLCLDDLSGILVTHEHSDHISGLDMLSKYCGIPIIASEDCAYGLIKVVPAAERFVSVFETGKRFELRGLEVNSFRTPHDAPGSVGYTIKSGGAKLAYVTDFGSVTDEIVDAVMGAQMAVVEANHDVEMLKHGPYPVYLQRRILSGNGHLSNDDSGVFCSALVNSGARYIVLAHLSKDNNTPRLAYDTVAGTISDCGAKTGRDMELEIAPRDVPGRVFEV